MDILDLSQSGAAFIDLDMIYADGNATVTFLGDSIVLVGVEALDPAVSYSFSMLCANRGAANSRASRRIAK